MSDRISARRIVICLSACALSATALTGCAKTTPPERKVEVSNSGFALDQLFTDDRGNTVYRFFDKGDWRYYVVGPDGRAQMLPSTRTARDDTFVEPGVGLGLGVGIGGPVHHR